MFEYILCLLYTCTYFYLSCLCFAKTFRRFVITCICETSAVNLLSRPTCSCIWQKHWPLSSVTCNTDTESGSRTITSLWWHAWNHITQSSLFTLCLGLRCLDCNIVAVGLLYFQVQASIHVDLGLKLKIKRFCMSHIFLENYLFKFKLIYLRSIAKQVIPTYNNHSRPLIPDGIHLFFFNEVWEEREARPVLICWAPSKEASGTIFITSLVWRGRGLNPRPPAHGANALNTEPPLRKLLINDSNLILLS